jgi:hypothetical protein
MGWPGSNLSTDQTARLPAEALSVRALVSNSVSSDRHPDGHPGPAGQSEPPTLSGVDKGGACAGQAAFAAPWSLVPLSGRTCPRVAGSGPLDACSWSPDREALGRRVDPMCGSWQPSDRERVGPRGRHHFSRRSKVLPKWGLSARSEPSHMVP